jgi:ADP-ribose pyrophosphatase
MDERVLRTETCFRGRLLRVDRLEVEWEPGRRATREVVRHPGAAVILPRLPDGRFVFVRQYRAAVGEVVLEAVAGTMGWGEDPAVCAHRELREETGFEAEELVKLGVVYPAPGYTEERLHLFLARLKPRGGPPAPDEDERLEPVLLAPEEIVRAILEDRIRDAKTIAAWWLYERKIVAAGGETR